MLRKAIWKSKSSPCDLNIDEHLVYMDLLLVLFLLLQEVLVLLLDDKLGQRVLRQRGGLGPVQGSVFW